MHSYTQWHTHSHTYLIIAQSGRSQLALCSSTGCLCLIMELWEISIHILHCPLMTIISFLNDLGSLFYVNHTFAWLLLLLFRLRAPGSPGLASYPGWILSLCTQHSQDSLRTAALTWIKMSEKNNEWWNYACSIICNKLYTQSTYREIILCIMNFCILFIAARPTSEQLLNVVFHFYAQNNKQYV